MLTVKELMQKLQLSRQTIYSMMKDGLPHVRLSKKAIRFDEAEVMSWIREKNKKGVNS